MRTGLTACLSRRILRAVALSLALGAAPGALMAQDYPNKPINVVIPFPPGGAGSTLIRIIEPKMAEILGQPLIIENKGGASGAIGAQTAKAAPKDGYTVLTPSNTLIADAVLRPDIGYNYAEDFAPVSELAYSPHYLIVRTDLGVNTIEEFVALAKEKPGKIAYAHSGAGGASHLTAEIFNKAAGIKLKAIPYKGMGDVLPAVLNGSVSATWDFVSNWKQHEEAGVVKVIGVGSAERTALRPDVPVIADTIPGFQRGAWVGMFTSAGAPPEAIARLSEAAQKVMQDPEVQDKIIAIGYTPVGSTAEDFGNSLSAEEETYRAVADALKAE